MDRSRIAHGIAHTCDIIYHVNANSIAHFCNSMDLARRAGLPQMSSCGKTPTRTFLRHSQDAQNPCAVLGSRRAHEGRLAIEAEETSHSTQRAQTSLLFRPAFCLDRPSV